MNLKAIVFDMDDTLYEEKDYVKSGFKAIDQWMRREYQAEGFFETAWDFFQSGETRLVFNRTLEKLNIAYDRALINRIVEYYRTHEPDIQLLDDAKRVLDHVKDTVKVGLISDGYLIAQEKKVKALQLEEKFHSVILTDKWGRESWKPSLVPYLQASRQLQLPHEQCVYVGDNASKDFITAKKLGWTTIHIHRKDGVYSQVPCEEEYAAHYTIGSLTSLMEMPMLKHMFH